MQDEEGDRKIASFRDYLATSQDTAMVFRWIWKEVVTEKSRKYLKKMFLYLACTIALAALQSWAINFIFTGLAAHDGEKVIKGLASFAFFLCLIKFFDRASERAREIAVGTNWRRMDDRIMELFFEKSVGQHVQDGTRLSVTSMNKGKGRLTELHFTLLFDGLPTIAHVVVSIVCLWILTWIGGLLMTVLAAIYYGWSLFLNYRVAKVCTPIEKDWRRLNRKRDERFEKIERVKVNGHEDVETAEMSAEFESIMDRDCAFWLWYIDCSFFRSLLNLLCLASCISWGTWLVWKGDWQVGLLYPLFAWSFRVSENIWKLGDIERKISSAMPSVKLMIEALQIKPAIVDRPGARDIDHSMPHRIEFVDVSHTYPAERKSPNGQKLEDGSPAALIRVSFTIEKGEKVAVIGPSGAGKSTLMKKLLRFEDPTSGCLRIGGFDLRDISGSSFRKGVGYIPQRDQVFDGTIRSNLTYGLDPEARRAVTDDDLWALMKLLQIDFGSRLTHGLDTKVGKGGLKLSGGQAQRLMIGAAVIKKPWLLVVDEATASLDSTTERLVQEGLEKVLSGNTSALIVAHRLSTVRRLCTKFIVLRPAEEVAPGESQVEAIAASFEELYKASPTFRRLADDQGIVMG